MADDSLLANLFDALGADLLERIKNGSATPADRNVARQWLKDNDISATTRHKVLNSIAEVLPFEDGTQDAEGSPEQLLDKDVAKG